MARLAFLQFYPNDWLAEPSIRSCSVAARGLWIDMLSLMHLSPRRGYLLAATGKSHSPEQLARLTGCSADEVSRLLAELESSGCFSCTVDGLIYSRRMVRDDMIRQERSAAGSAGGKKSAELRACSSKTSSKRQAKGQAKSNLPEARDQNPEEEPPNPPPGGVATKPPRERNLVFDAIADVTGRDPLIRRNAAEIGRTAASIAKGNPPYSADEVREFARRFHELCPWAAEKGFSRPSPGIIENHISLLRAKSVPIPTAPPRAGSSRRQTDDDYYAKQMESVFVHEVPR